MYYAGVYFARKNKWYKFKESKIKKIKYELTTKKNDSAILLYKVKIGKSKQV